MIMIVWSEVMKMSVIEVAMRVRLGEVMVSW